MIKEMLSVFMDGIKDADMMLDYAIKAMHMEDDTYGWFVSKARMRIDSLSEDYKAIDRELGLDVKAGNGDMIAEALKVHLMSEMTRLRDKVQTM